MRAVILLAAIIIAESINVAYIETQIDNSTMGLIFIVCAAMDVYEFINNMFDR